MSTHLNKLYYDITVLLYLKKYIHIYIQIWKYLDSLSLRLFRGCMSFI